MTARVNRSSLRYTLKCQKCNYRFATEQDLMSHSCPEVLTEGYSCNNCKFVFDTDEPLKRHLKFCDEYRPNSDASVCKTCGDVFKSQEDLKSHESDAHAKKNQLKCKYCQATFTSHRNMSIHERVHEREPVSCSICKYQFTSFASLKVHIWQAHQQKMSAEMVRLLEKCRVCYKYYDGEQAHICKKDGLVVGTSAMAVGPPYRCSECDHVFFKFSNYEAHMYSHTVGNMSDSDCSSVLKRGATDSLFPDPLIPAKKPSPIADHLPATSDRPYRCDVCGCRFKYDFSLSAHVSSHNSVERRAIDEFAKIVQSHEEGEGESGGEYLIEAIDVEDLRRQTDRSNEGHDSKNHAGLLNLIIGHFQDDDLSALGLFQTNQPSSHSLTSDRDKGFSELGLVPVKVEPPEEYEERELMDLDTNQKVKS